MILTGTGNKCPVCGKEFQPLPPLEPNTKQREFYGGRIKFFKTVDCDCTAKYRLCIEKKFNAKEPKEELSIINMIVLKEGVPLAELKKQENERIKEEAEQEAKETVKEMMEETGEMIDVRQRMNIKRQIVLASIPDLEDKIQTLCLRTVHELQIMCKRRKIKWSVKDNKRKLAEKLLAYDPSMVVSGPED